MTERMSDAYEMMYALLSRVIVVFVLAVLSLVGLFTVSNGIETGAFPADAKEPFDLAFQVVGVCFVVYPSLPVLRFGLNHRDTWLGKAYAGGSGLAILVAIVLAATG